MLSFPPFKYGANVFTASEVACGVELVEPTRGHTNTAEATRARNVYFRLAVHPYSMHIFDFAANCRTRECFREAARNKLNSLMDYADLMAKTQELAQGFNPVKVGQDWLMYKESFLVKAVKSWPEADKRVKAITSMLDEFGMLQEDTFDNEAGVCDTRYTEMMGDMGVLVSLIKDELMKGSVLCKNALKLKLSV